ncbi:GumC family protein [Candidatus Entotheonella palauensis]|uniref:GumC family protein n=1 Tax=Candidatus Entotheonella palauensis TaxID=93172 RepID=UPI000B7FDE3C|nr:GumC family protein [Candidatus Entotheonella palauensis]
MPPLEALSEQGNQLWSLWRMLRKRLWMIIAVYVAMTLTITLDAMKEPPMYRATAQLLIEHENPNVISFDEAVGVEYVHDSDVPSSSYYKTQYNILQSRSLARRVIRTLDLHRHPVFTSVDAPSLLETLKALPKRWLLQLIHGAQGLVMEKTETGMPTQPQAAADPESALIGRFLNQLTIAPIPGTRLVNVHFAARTPYLAAEVANTLANIYVDQNLEMRFAASQESVNWLHQRVKEMRDKVERAELALQRYKETHNIVSFQDHQNTVVNQLTELNKEFTRAKTNLIGVEALYQQVNDLSRQPNLIESIPAVMNNVRIQGLKQDRDATINIISRLEERLKSQHPDIIKYKSKVNELQQKIDDEIDNVLSSIDVDYNVKKLHLEKLKEAFEQYKIEAQNLNKLSIKYNVLSLNAQSNRDLYDILLESVKKTGISMELERNNIRVIESAEVPNGPMNTILISKFTQASLLGLVLGLGLAFLLESFDSTIKTPEEAQRLLELPVLCTVRQLKTRQKKTEQMGAGLVSLQMPHSQAAEAFKTLCTNLLLGYAETPRNIFLVTSPNPRDGKTTVAANLAIGMA